MLTPSTQPEGGAMIALSGVADLVQASADAVKQMVRPKEGEWGRIGRDLAINMVSKGGKILESVENIGAECGKQLQGILEVLGQVAQETNDAISQDEQQRDNQGEE